MDTTGKIEYEATAGDQKISVQVFEETDEYIGYVITRVGPSGRIVKTKYVSKDSMPPALSEALKDLTLQV